MKLSQELIWRGSIKDYTFNDYSYLDKPHKFYIGVDPSADSMTIGNLASLILAQRLIKAGYTAVILVGGATVMIGDPSDKAEERALKSKTEIENNLIAIKKEINQIFRDQTVEIVNNYDWFKDINFLDFLRDVGKFFPISELANRDFVQSRINVDGTGISYAEFSYTLIQGYDFYHLATEHQVDLQLGGSDQWGNLLSGIDLIKKKTNQDVEAFTLPLVINKTTGRKFGKSEGGAVWLDPKKTSPTEFYQFFINVADEEVEYLLKIYTFFNKSEVDNILEEHQKSPELRFAQAKLAGAVTTLVHGEEMADTAYQVSQILTGKKPLNNITATELEELKNNLSTVEVDISTPISDILVKAKLASSKTEAKKLITGNAIALNFTKINRENLEITDFISNRLLIKRGKAFKDSALISLIS